MKVHFAKFITRDSKSAARHLGGQKLPDECLSKYPKL